MRERMMERSEERIGAVAHQDGHAARAAGRLLESAHLWRDWTASHVRLLDGISTQRRTAAQVRAVRRMALTTIHRKAPFECLRDMQIRGPARRHFLEDMYGGGDQARLLVLEHRGFISAICSYVCVEDFCGLGSLRRIRAYELSYARYWQARTSALLGADAGANDAGDAPLRDYLRDQVLAARNQLLEAAPAADDAVTLAELRRPTGDTVRLRRPT